MALITEAPKGTKDKLPADIYKWQTIEKVAKDIAETYGCKEIRTPIFEHTELFLRGVGDTTDVVQKEMYTFNDKGDRSITLRPEGTAGVVRAALQNGLLNGPMPLKLYYFARCYRYEQPQYMRDREFDQFGVEVFGADKPVSDAEVISIACDLIKTLGIKDITLEINSIGCPECRANYQKALKEYYSQFKDELCNTCLDRLERNPMRLLDCKSKICREFGKNAPLITDYLCEKCDTHFKETQKALGLMGIDYIVNPKIVRGLDYYTNTVFEFIAQVNGSPLAIGAGGRYNGLVGEVGGNPTPGLGFGMGLVRILSVMESQGLEYQPPKQCDLYIAGTDDASNDYAVLLVKQLRDYGFWAECDLVGRGLKAQMKYADKIGANFSMVLGGNELESGIATLKNMKTGDKTDVNIKGNFADTAGTVLMGFSADK